MSGGPIKNFHILLIDIQREMIRAASKVIMCLDSSKFGRRSVAALCTLDEVDTIVTDNAVSPEIADQIKSKGVELVIA